jgi:hypothetical protein
MPAARSQKPEAISNQQTANSKQPVFAWLNLSTHSRIGRMPAARSHQQSAISNQQTAGICLVEFIYTQ